MQGAKRLGTNTGRTVASSNEHNAARPNQGAGSSSDDDVAGQARKLTAAPRNSRGKVLLKKPETALRHMIPYIENPSPGLFALGFTDMLEPQEGATGRSPEELKLQAQNSSKQYPLNPALRQIHVLARMRDAMDEVEPNQLKAWELTPIGRHILEAPPSFARTGAANSFVRLLGRSQPQAMLRDIVTKFALARLPLASGTGTPGLDQTTAEASLDAMLSLCEKMVEADFIQHERRGAMSPLSALSEQVALLPPTSDKASRQARVDAMLATMEARHNASQDAEALKNFQ